MGFGSVMAGLAGTATNGLLGFMNYQQQKNELDYQHDLQKQMFEREDTAYQRTATDMLNAGLNPLTMQGTNGAGEAIATNAPQMDNEALTKGFQTMASQMESMISGQQNRDLLQSQIDRQQLENIAYARDNGLVYNPKHALGVKSSPIKKKTYSVEPKELGENNFAYTTNGIQLGSNPKIKMGDKEAFFDLNDPYARRMQSEMRQLEKELFDSWDNSHDVEFGNHVNDTQVERNLTTLQNWLDKDRLLNLLTQLKNTGVGLGASLLEDFGFSSKKRK